MDPPERDERIHQAPKAPAAIAPAEERKACPYCGEEILAVAHKCKHCGEFLEWNGVAACLSLFWPGMGHLYRGALLPALAWGVLIPFAYVLPVVIASITHLPAIIIMVIPGFLVHFLCIRDAGHVTAPPSQVPQSVLRVMGLVLAIMVVVSVGWYLYERWGY